jgi:dCMP deaminase
VSSKNTVIGQGFNGFPRGVADLPERLNDRETKYAMVVHAESNALLFSEGDTTGATLYVWPFMPCSSCAGKAIQKGIARVVTVETSPDLVKRWGVSLEITKTMFHEAGVELIIVPLQEFADFLLPE